MLPADGLEEDGFAPILLSPPAPSRESLARAASPTLRPAAGDGVGQPTASLRRWSRALFLVPVAAFVGLAVTFGIGLDRDPSRVPSPLIGKPVPIFRLP